jgi:hypothetical protein
METPHVRITTNTYREFNASGDLERSAGTGSRPHRRAPAARLAWREIEVQWIKDGFKYRKNPGLIEISFFQRINAEEGTP